MQPGRALTLDNGSTAVCLPSGATRIGRAVYAFPRSNELWVLLSEVSATLKKSTADTWREFTDEWKGGVRNFNKSGEQANVAILDAATGKYSLTTRSVAPSGHEAVTALIPMSYARRKLFPADFSRLYGNDVPQSTC